MIPEFVSMDPVGRNQIASEPVRTSTKLLMCCDFADVMSHATGNVSVLLYVRNNIYCPVDHMYSV